VDLLIKEDIRGGAHLRNRLRLFKAKLGAIREDQQKEETVVEKKKEDDDEEDDHPHLTQLKERKRIDYLVLHGNNCKGSCTAEKETLAHTILLLLEQVPLLSTVYPYRISKGVAGYGLMLSFDSGVITIQIPKGGKGMIAVKRISGTTCHYEILEDAVDQVIRYLFFSERTWDE
jgi:hypothetical protein